MLPGLDGRKMSKSYDNTIPLFAPREQLRKLINGIVTDSRAPGQAKETEGSALFQIYQAFASESETAALRQAYAEGIGWGDAKQLLFERIDREVAPMRERYQALIGNPQTLEALLQAGAEKARAVATPFMGELRRAVGLRNLGSAAPAAAKGKAAKAAGPAFKQYREKDGRFYFKLLGADAALLLQSRGFDSPREAALAISTLQQEGCGALATLADKVDLAPGLGQDELAAALRAFTPD
jgi:tryptophanyl-tRNA synthetase